jgi:polysaccharide biosynthesis/export protein
MSWPTLQSSMLEARRALRSSALLAALILGAAAPVALAAQQRPTPQQTPRTAEDTAAARRALQQQFGRNVSQAEVIERLRQSGMTRAQVRARLQQAGFAPGLADRYFDVLERGGEPPRGEASEEFLQAMQRIGVVARVDRRTFGADTLEADSLRLSERDSLLLAADDRRDRMEVFGLRTFRRSSTQFDPTAFGPVDANYRVGPGDELMLVLTGDVEAAYNLTVTREGFVFIPDVGQISVNGLSLGQLEDQLYARLSRVYSGVSRSPSATTRFQITLGQLRSNQIFVRGEVALPGAYQVSSVAGLFTALYQAGGPTADGSFRRVQVHRGPDLVHTADLYEFLVGGSVASDIRLEHNDHIFVPPAGPQIRIEGSVRRPAIYEIRPGEGVRSVLGFAGGLRSDALVRRIQIDRVLPPDQQRPGYYRTLVDVDLTVLASTNGDLELHDGDILTVFGVNDERRNRIWVEGEVRNPGLYEWRPGATLWSVLARADGLSERAYTARAHVHRLVESDGSRRLIPVSLERDENGLPLHDLPLADTDSIVILSQADLRTPEFVTIDGFVKFPETYRLDRGMSLKDLILAAGGFIDGAYLVEAEVTRLPDSRRWSDTTAYVLRASLDPAGSDNGHGGVDDTGVPRWIPQADELRLQHGDRVFIRRAPGYEPLRQVYVTGEVMTPGAYVLATRSDRLSDVVARAGGLTKQAYPAGVNVVREGRVVAGGLERALRNPRDRNNLLLVGGDTINVPAYNPTVTVTGAVNFEASVVYVPGKSLSYYVEQAGGYADNADRKRTIISYANGERSPAGGNILFSRRAGVEPGSQIFVPAVADRPGVNWDQFVMRSAAVLSAVATLILGISQLR